MAQSLSIGVEQSAPHEAVKEILACPVPILCYAQIFQHLTHQHRARI